MKEEEIEVHPIIHYLRYPFAILFGLIVFLFFLTNGGIITGCILGFIISLNLSFWFCRNWLYILILFFYTILPIAFIWILFKLIFALYCSGL